jgi:hypothetical protein
MGSVNWVLKGIEAVGPRVKAARRKVPKVNLGGLFGRRAPEDASPHDAVDACDASADTLERALCMGSFDPFASTSAGWTWRSAEKARSKSPKVDIGGLWGAQAGSLREEAEACELSDDTLTRALCIDDYDPLSRGSASWVLKSFETADGARRSQEAAPTMDSTGNWFSKFWRTPLKSSPSAVDI